MAADSLAQQIQDLNQQYLAWNTQYNSATAINNPPDRAEAMKQVKIGITQVIQQTNSLVSQAQIIATQSGNQQYKIQLQGILGSSGQLLTNAASAERAANQLPPNGTTTGNSNTPVDDPTNGRPTGGIGNPTGRSGDAANVNLARAQAVNQDASNYALHGDWRVRLALAPQSGPILYRAPSNEVGLLAPLQETDGVIFPYTPAINMTYTAKYDDINILQTNYRVFQYSGSGIENISIACDFTAQDTYEANYLLAAIHFFRTATKMFYGQDSNPKPGTPPPICYLYGLGEFQFNGHPLVINSFSYNLPNNVHYIRASAVTTPAGENRAIAQNRDFITVPQDRLQSGGQNMNTGGVYKPTMFVDPTSSTYPPTYVPTSIQLTIGAYPLISRNQISNQYSTKQYATGSLMQGSRQNGGGFW